MVLDKFENVSLLFNSQDVVIIPADEGFYDDGKLLRSQVSIIYGML